MKVDLTMIPPEVVEAAAAELHGAWDYADAVERIKYRIEARAAIAAALAAWPGKTSYVNVEGQRVLILPLPQQENGDAE